GGRETLRRRRGAARQARYDRVRLWGVSSFRAPTGEPLEPGTVAGRFVQRLRGGHCRVAVLRLARVGHGGIDSLSLRRVRRRRCETYLRQGEPLWCLSLG